ncbi:MAG: uroporphyrinogen decarboxylase family protein [Bacillota bacterium]|nr:uroporphyrinogen decarboxylase family protein [Bacillota bacterium]
MTIKTASELSKERLERIERVIELKEPDRVPLAGVMGDMVPAYSGITQHEYCYDYEKSREATVKFLQDFPCDMSFAGITGVGELPLSIAFSDYPDISPSISFVSGPLHDVLGDKYARFPGRELAEDSSPQFIGGEWMQPGEYEDLIEDPVRFVAETVLPRVCRNLEKPGSRQTMATMARLGMELSKLAAFGQALAADLAELGYPPAVMAFAYSPLDFIGDFLRDVTNVLLDLRRYPDKVKQACEALVEPILKVALALKPAGAKLAFIPLHLNEYLSPDLYNEFYWPHLKRIIAELGNEGMKSFVFFEGYHDAHLETILELPAGWGIAYFEKTDVRKAKKILKGHTCVMGGIPMGLLISGTPEKIDEYVKNLLEEVKPGGGFILASGTAIAPRETSVENIRALIDAVEKYGRY